MSHSYVQPLCAPIPNSARLAWDEALKLKLILAQLHGPDETHLWGRKEMGRWGIRGKGRAELCLKGGRSTQPAHSIHLAHPAHLGRAGHRAGQRQQKDIILSVPIPGMGTHPAHQAHPAEAHPSSPPSPEKEGKERNTGRAPLSVVALHSIMMPPKKKGNKATTNTSNPSVTGSTASSP
jgi:hypothetical protein